MRRTAMILVVAALMVGVFASVALAASNVWTGTDERDVKSGTKQDEVLKGMGGDDTLNGFGGQVVVKGGDGPVEMGGGYGSDKAYGNAGNDNLIDAPDKNKDFLYGGTGDDTVQVRDFPAVKDVVYCGPGTDTAYVDKLDVTNDCERVRLP
jgi:Ca2+-binding RTX toxin-like protein